MILYTVGHSNHTQAEFLHLLKVHGVDYIVDIRSVPASKHNPQFNQEVLESFLNIHSIGYQFMGNEFGARRTDSMNKERQVDFERAVHTPLFQNGVQKLNEILQHHTVALMCSEANPLDCHRFALVARYFHERGLKVQHILRSAELADHLKLEHEMIEQYLHAKRPLLPDIDELFGIYTAAQQLQDAYKLKNKEIGYKFQQQEDYFD